MEDWADNDDFSTYKFINYFTHKVSKDLQHRCGKLESLSPNSEITLHNHHWLTVGPSRLLLPEKETVGMTDFSSKFADFHLFL